MKAKTGFAAFLLIVFVAMQTSSAQPGADPLPPIPGVLALQPDGKEQPKQKDKEKKKKPPEKKLTDRPETDAFTGNFFPRTDLPTGFNPHMMGDIRGYFARMGVILPAVQTTTTTTTMKIFSTPSFITTTTTTSSTATVNLTRILVVPFSGHGPFKVAENASPRPQDRVYLTYNFYYDIWAPQNDPITRTTTTTTTVGTTSTTTTVTTAIPGAPFVNLHRTTVGLEKTFLDGRASIEARLPYLVQPSGVDGFQFSHLGDVTIVGRYAFLLDRTTGDVISGGLAVTVPTGPGIDTVDGKIHSTLLQPWGGYIWNFDRFYFQGFHSFVFPTDQRDITFLFNDVSVNYWLFRGDPNRPLNFIVPTVEVHVTTPLSQRGRNNLLYSPDTVVLTGGVHLGLFRNSTLTLGVANPVTGPCPVGVEAFAQFNWRY